MFIYKLTKPSDPMTVYIGSTDTSLTERMYKHKNRSKTRSDLKVYQWYDNTCKIVLIEESDTPIREFEVINEYITEGYDVMNIRTGKHILDPIGNNKAHSIKYTANRHPDYHKWSSSICQKAKKENLTSKEYREKYNIPNYTGPKTI